MTSTKAPNYLTTADVSKLLKVPQNTLRSWRHEGKGPPSFKIGNLVRYDADELQQYIDRCKEGNQQ